jgi:hypothetical protein
VGLEPTIPMFERTKTFHDLDSAATVIGIFRERTGHSVESSNYKTLKNAMTLDSVLLVTQLKPQNATALF